MNASSKQRPHQMALAGPSRQVGGLDIRQLIGVFRRRIAVFITCFVAVTVAVVVITLMMTPRYTATAKLLIDPNQKQITDFDEKNTGRPPDTAIVDTQVSIMTSREVARAVVNQLDLTHDEEFYGKPRGLKALMGQSTRVATPLERQEKTVDALLKQVSAQREGTTYLVGLTASSIDPGKAARLANAFVEHYQRESLRMSVGAASEQAKWLEERVAAMGKEVEAADAKLAAERARTGIVSGTSAVVTDQQIGALTSQMGAADSDAAAARAKLDAARAQIARGGLDSVSDVLSSRTIQDLRSQRAVVGREQADINARYGPLHPDSRRVAEQLAGIDRQIQEESRRIVNGLESNARAASASASSLRSTMGGLKGELASNSRAMVQVSGAERDAEAKRNIYNQLAASLQQVDQQQKLNQPKGEIIASASAPSRPSFPNKPIFFILGLVLGAMIGTTVVFVLDAFDAGVRSAEDIEENLGATYLGSVPELSQRDFRQNGRTFPPWDFVRVKPMSSYAEAIRSIRSTLKPINGVGGEVVAITSSLPGEGKTVFSMALARIMAMSGGSIVVVDCDLRRATLSAVVPSRTTGLVQVLSGEATLEQALIADAVGGLKVLPLTRVEFTPHDILSTPQMLTLIEELRKRFDCVVLDTPPILAVADSRTLCAAADSVVFLTRWARTPMPAVRMALGRLEQAGANMAGVVLSIVNTRSNLSESDSNYYMDAYRSYYQN